MIINTKVALPYYGEFNLYVNFHERESIGTCAVNFTTKGANFYYSPSFLDKKPQMVVNFIVIHETFHLIFNHPRRTITGIYDPTLANIAQDMIINHVIWEDISHFFVEIPKDDDGKNMALFVPLEYKGALIFEELYEWLKDKKDEWKKQKCKNDCKTCGGTGKEQQKGKGDKKEEQGDGEKEEGEGGQGSEPCPDCGGSGKQEGKDSSGKSSYGPFGKGPSKENGRELDKPSNPLDTWSLDKIFDDMDKNQGQYLDVHIGDDVPEDMRDEMVRDVMEKLASRGLVGGDIEGTLGKLRKKRKDYLREIKRSLSNLIFGHLKQKTILKPNRRQIPGLKGHKKIKTMINVILDTSGSMGSDFEKVLDYIYRNDIEINFVEGDTEVKWTKRIKSKKQVQSIKISGLGGTVLMPMVNYVVEHFNKYNTLILTDGYTDSLDLSKLLGRVLIISVGTEVPIASSNGKLKQIVVEKTH